MKKRITVRFSEDLLLQIDREIGPDGSRSAFIEKVLRDHFRDESCRTANKRDLETLNKGADYFNREMEDVLRHQADPFESETLTYQEALDLKLIVVPLSRADVEK
jgi:metal-responsive CopG/Arc/MetJ family transcriptional regulator